MKKHMSTEDLFHTLWGQCKEGKYNKKLWCQLQENLKDTFAEEKKDMWKCKDGEFIHPRNMDTDHIKNALAMLKRKGFISFSHWEMCLSCPPQGDMAQMAWEQEIMNLKPSKFIEIFEEELAKRGLHD